MEQLYAYIPGDAQEGDTLDAFTVAGWKRRKAGGKRFQNCSSADLLRNGLVAVGMIAVPGGGVLRDSRVVLNADGTVAQTGTVVTAAELEAEQTAQQSLMIDETRAQMLVVHQELAIIFNGFLQICGIVNGLPPDDPGCKMGFPALLNVKNSFASLPAGEQDDIIARATAAGFDGPDAAAIIADLAGELLTLDVWGKRYDIIHPELAAIGGWWEICEYQG